MRTLVKNLVKTFGTERVGYEDSVVLLIPVIVVLERLLNSLVDLVDRHSFYVIGCESQGKSCVHGHLSLLSEIPEGSVEEVTVMDGNYNGHLFILMRDATDSGMYDVVPQGEYLASGYIQRMSPFLST